MLKIQDIKLTELKMYKDNPRKNENAVSAVAASIKEFGMKVPIIIDKNYVIVAGHTRLKALQKLGIDTAPCIIADDLTDEQIKAFRIADNSTAQVAEWDMQKLMAELETIDLDMTMFGLDEQLKEIEREFAPEVIEDEVPEVSDGKAVTELGDIWQLDRHRLMCADSTDALNYKHLTQGVKVDLVFTDPPYGMKKEADGVLNDNLNYDKLLEFNKQWIPHTFDALKDNGSWYCWGIDEPLMDIYSNILKPMMRENKITFRNLLTWDKGNGQGQLSEDFRMYPIADEKCLFVMVGGDSVQGFCVNQEDYSENMDKVRVYLETEIKKLKQSDKVIANALGYKDGRTVNHWWSKSQFALPTRENYEALREYGKSVLKDYDFLKKDYDELKKDFYEGRSFFDNTHDNMNNVWHFDRTTGEERELTGGHATPKPIALCSRAIKSSSREGEIVLDVFGGSGSTLIACEQLNRICYMMELDPKYCDVIIERFIKLTGKEVYLLKGEEKIPYSTLK
jgi:DNA modification methylase